MRLSLAPALLAAATLVVAQLQVRQDAPKTINPPLSSVKNINWAEYDAAHAAQPVTNAQRLARGLPPLVPKSHRRHSQRGAPRRLGTRVQSAPRADTSPLPPVSQKCNILVKTYNSTVGFLAAKLNTVGEYGTFTQTQTADSLLVSFSYSPDSPSQFDMLATNPQSKTYPYVGGVVGFTSSDDDLGPDNANYAYIAGTTQSPPGSPAVVGDSTFGTATGVPGDYESAIWAYDPATQAISPQWINMDESAPATYALYAPNLEALILTGDINAFNNNFGTSYEQVTFVCVPFVEPPQPTFK